MHKTYSVLEVTLMEGSSPSRKTILARLTEAKAKKQVDSLNDKLSKQDYVPGTPVVCYLAQVAN